MAEWRFGRGWSGSELRDRRAHYDRLERNFSTPPDEMHEACGWTRDGIDEVVGHERPGPPVPDGFFERGRDVLVEYEFSDPSIVSGHFAPEHARAGRTMLLVIRVLGFRYLVGIRIGDVFDRSRDDCTSFGIRYDTLEGHVERGVEWVLLTKDHETGDVSLRIEARWRFGDFPNWWSALGFRLLAPYYRPLWRRHAHERLRDLVEAAAHPHERRRRPPPGPVGPPPAAAPAEPENEEDTP